MAEVPQKRDAAASEDEQTTKKQKTEGGTGLRRADGTPWEPITGTLVPIVGGKEGLKQEWTMIELQGDLIKKTETFDNQKLGDLEVRDSTPFLTIGIHELEGEFVTLKKPFVVLDPQQDEDETVTTCRGVECRSKFTVAGVIRRKVLFKLRPRVLVQRAAGPAEVVPADAASSTASELTPKDVVS